MADRTSLASLSRVALVMLSVLGAPWLVSSARAQDAAHLDSSKAFVLVNRHEVRVFFAPEPANAWGRLAIPADGGVPRFSWLAMLEGRNGPRFLSLRFRGEPGGVVPSLDSIVRAGQLELCWHRMMQYDCFGADAAAKLENGRIVLSYLDTAAIRQMFGLRPMSIPLLRIVPSEMRGDDTGFHSAPVRYVEPLILVDSAQRAAIASERRRLEASINRYGRVIDGGSGGRTLHLGVGDSAMLLIQDYHCFTDMCGPHDYLDDGPREWGRWSLADSSVARLRPLAASEADGTGYRDARARGIMIIAARPGRTMIRATGVRTPADTLPSSTRLDSIVEREVVVTRGIGRVLISPRVSRVTAGQSLAFTVRVFDTSGHIMEDAWAELRGESTSHMVRSPMEQKVVRFAVPGLRQIIATRGTHADTVHVHVQPAVRGP